MLDVQSAVIREGGEMGMGMGIGMESGDAFPDFLDSIDFDDLFLDVEILPDLLSDYSAAVSENKPDSSGSSSSSTSSGNGNGKKDDNEKRVTSNHVKKTSTTASSKNNGGKRKVKVDWTPHLHRRFVQAVEQLGVDKAVPSRILEIMGIDCLTRHNIASHLQKYRSHRKHLVAREAEAASWSQRRQLYKREPTAAGPTMGFPTMQMQMQMPLHVWGHPKTTPHYPTYSQYPPHPHRGVVPNALGMPCFPHPPPVPPLPLPPQPHCILPSKESIDAAIGDVIAKPWLPLPLGLKPPCMEGVMGHLQRHGVPDLPPSSSS